jgi:hypothetical protein
MNRCAAGAKKTPDDLRRTGQSKMSATRSDKSTVITPAFLIRGAA